MSNLERPLCASRIARRAAVLLCGLLAATPDAGAQALRGLVVGIDDYEHIGKLAGAVNDALDIGEALAGIGADDLTILLDGDATRARIVAEWRGLMERAAPGDTLVLAYAGHGGQEPERVPGTERDGQDEALLLGGFRTEGSGTRERIVDDEINAWFLDAGAKGLRVVFIADACHSGTLTRSLVDPRAPSPIYRTAPRYALPDDELVLGLPEEAADTGEAGHGLLAHVSMLAAAQEHQKVPEIAVGGKMRGALSYMFARAVRGEADADGDGLLSRGELWDFVRENVRMESNSQQTPNLEPSSRADEIVLRLTPTSSDAEVQPVPVRLAVLNATSDTLASVRGSLADVRIVPVGAPADLVWDALALQVVTGMGDVAAHDVDVEALPGVAEKWAAVAAVKELSARNGLRMRIHPGDGVHRRGSRIKLRVEGLAHSQLTVFSLSGNGRVHYLHPQPGDPAEVAIDRPFVLEAEVTPPFGADHLVAVSADGTLDGLNAALERLDGRVAAGRAAALLAAAKAGARGWSSGIQGLYTAP